MISALSKFNTRTTITPARAAIALMLVGMALFSLNDAIGKWMVATYSIGQVLLIRSSFAILILLPFLWESRSGSFLNLEKPLIQVLRAAFSTAEVFCFYSAVVYLPLADVMTFWLAAPIYVAALSPLLLGETVGLRRWLAIAVGFVGVLVALAPSGEIMRFPTLVAIVGTLFFALMVITGRYLRATPDKTLVLWQILGAGLAGLVLAPFEWTTPGTVDFVLLGILGVVAMGAHLCVTRALKLADASVVAPFQYTLLPWAVLLGWLFFADVPRPEMLLGAAIIVSAGLFIFFDENRKA